MTTPTAPLDISINREALPNLFPLARFVRMTTRQLELRDDFNHKICSREIPYEWVPCLCGNKDQGLTYLLAEKDRYGLLQSTVICKMCGLIQSNPRMSSSGYIQFYTSDHYRRLYEGDNYNDGYEANYYPQAGIDILKAVECARGRPVGREDRVLEIGAGGGWNLIAFKHTGAVEVGFDYGETLVALGRSHGIDLKRGSTDDAVQLAEKEGKFSIVILNHVLEHFLDPIRELKQLLKLADEGCCLFIGVPRIDYPHLGLLQNAHTYYFNANTLSHYLAVSGWKANLITYEHSFAMHTVARVGTGNVLDMSGECERTLKQLRDRRVLLIIIRTWRVFKERVRELFVQIGLWVFLRNCYRRFR